MKNQNTLRRAISFSGIGLHTGKPVNMSIEPAPPEHGIKFSYNGNIIKASAENLGGTARNTGLTDGTHNLHTVEHVISALLGMNVDNALVIMDSTEPPAMDGSAKDYAKAIKEAGLLDSGVPVRELPEGRTVFVSSNGASVTWIPGGPLEFIYVLEFEHLLVGNQAYRFRGGPDEYLAEIAPARTFGFIEEVEKLRQAGLALGGSEENAVVVYPDRLSSDLRYPDEFARHKLLDLIGDIGLMYNMRPTGTFIGVRSGHALNAQLVKTILAI